MGFCGELIGVKEGATGLKGGGGNENGGEFGKIRRVHIEI